MLKGTVAVLAANYLFGRDVALVAGLGAFLGHLFPVWLKFKGGKGVATFIGTLFGLSQAEAETVAAPEARPFVPETEAQLLELDPCDGAAHECADIRSVYVDRGVDEGELGGVWLHYDYEEVTRAVTITAEGAAKPACVAENLVRYLS